MIGPRQGTVFVEKVLTAMMRLGDLRAVLSTALTGACRPCPTRGYVALATWAEALA